MTTWKTGLKVCSRVAILAVLFVLLTGARHRVREGETYASVADAFGVSEGTLRRANPDKKVIEAGDIITVPNGPPQQRWSPAHPYAPPVPTLGQLQKEIGSGNVVLSENPDYRGYYFMWAGSNRDIEIGQIHPVVNSDSGRTAHDFYLLEGAGGATTGSRLGRTTTFRRPATVEDCTCVPTGR